MADQYVKFEFNNGQSVLVQAEPLTKELGNVKVSKRNGGSEVLDAEKKLNEALEPLKQTTESLFQSFEGMVHRPDEIEVELSIKITAEAGMIITKGSVEGNFKISLKWVKDK